MIISRSLHSKRFSATQMIALFVAAIPALTATVSAQTDAPKNEASEAQVSEKEPESPRETRWNHFSSILAERRGRIISDEIALSKYEKLLETEGKGTDLEPFLLYGIASLQYALEDLKLAKENLDLLLKNFPKHYLNSRRITSMRHVGTNTGTNSIEWAQRIVDDQIAWRNENPIPWTEPTPAPSPKVVLDTDEGEITILLYPDVAPKHVENFLKLVKEGYYDGLSFHRVDPNLRALIGDPYSKEGMRDERKGPIGSGGPDYRLDPEPNLVRHVRGTVSGKFIDRERKDHGSQFFLNTGHLVHNDLKSTVFGRIESGIEVVDRIVSIPLNDIYRPSRMVRIKTARAIR